MPKTVQDYLANNETAEAALAAAVADVNSAHTDNATARSFRRTWEPVLRELNIPATQEGVEQLREALSGSEDSPDVGELAALVEDLTGVLEDLGIDFDAPEEELQAQLDALPDTFEKAMSAYGELETVRAEQLGRDLADVGKANAGVLTDRLKTAGLTAKVVGDAPKSGEQDKRTVRLYDADGKDVGELREYATQNWGDYLTSLFPVQTAQPQGGKVVTGQAGAGAGAPAKDSNPIRAALGSESKAEAPVVSAFDFSGGTK